MPPSAASLSSGVRRRKVWPGVVLGLWVFVVALAVILSGRGGPSEAGDQDKYHLVVIGAMVEQWPAIDVVNYQSATSPGYHALMASLGVLFGDEAGGLVMRLVNALVGSLLPVWCYVVARRFTSAGRAFALSAPLALNSYLVGGSAYLTTDNAGLLLALVALGVAVGWPASAWRAVVIGLVATLAAVTRQVHLWSAGSAGLAALAAMPWLRGERFALVRPWLAARASERPVALGVASAVAFAAPMAVIGWFVWKWGGLVPPAYAAMHNGGANLAGLALAFGLAGVIAPAFSLVATPLWRSDAYRSRSAVVGAAVGLAAALASPTTFQMKERALGWLWHGVWLTPSVGERSVLLTVLAPIGGAALGMLFSAATRRGRGAPALVLVLCVGGWMAAQTMNTMAWQRYFEPMVLVSVAWLAAMGAHTARETRGLDRPSLQLFVMLERAWWLGPLGLVAIEAGVTAVTLIREVVSAAPVNF